MTTGLRNKRVIITAAATGIGRATAEGFLAAGAKVHICDVDEAGLAAFKGKQPSLGTTVADVSDPGQVDRLFDEASKHLGGLDVMVNNAGIAGPTGNIEDIKPEDWRRTLEVNLDGTYLCCRRAVPEIKKNNAGAIVNLSSAAGVFPFARRTPYAAAKWAIVGVTKSLALELGPFNIRVNCICPGGITTPLLTNRFPGGAEAMTPLLAMLQPLQRPGYPEDIAAMALFLVADDSRLCTAQSFVVDAGWA